MLKEKIGEELKNAMKSKDEKLTMVLRNLRAKIIELEKKDLNATVNDADLVGAFVKLAKERKESAEVYAKANRQDLADAELYELSIIEQYLPKQMSVE
ncbi:MAG: GatB/YqeY domain-containing protein, partial [Candidatus Sericytochromatia bacterium]